MKHHPGMNARWATRALRVAAVLSAIVSMGHGGEGGCGHSDAAGAAGSGGFGPPTQAVCPPAQTLTYAGFGRAFLDRYCQRCHASTVSGAARNGAPADHVFDGLIEIRGLAMHIEQKAGSGPAGTNTSMPTTDPKPTQEERRKLSEWLACGAPE